MGVLRDIPFFKLAVIKALTGFHDIDDQKPDNKGDGGHDFKINKCFSPDFADFFHVSHLGDAKHDRQEYDRCDNHFYRIDKCIAERLHLLPGLRPNESDNDADDHRRDDLHRKIFENFHPYSPCLSMRLYKDDSVFIRRGEAYDHNGHFGLFGLG